MFEFTCNKLTDRVTQIVDPTGVSCFLVQGDDKAVLIDTAVGFKGLRDTVKGLTNLPLEVILTHAHGDHAGGAGEFEEVYLHPADKPLLKVHGMEKRTGYAAATMGPDVKLTDDLFVSEPEMEFKELYDGQLFSLGGLTLKIIHVPGHTKGCCCVLLMEERSILYGDACNGNTLVMDEASTTISEYKKSLEYLKTFEKDYDTAYYSHGPAVGPRECLEDNMELCDRILAGTDDAVECEFMGRKAVRAAKIQGHFERVDGKSGNIVYSELTKK